jgi:hypothetical protein
MRARALLISWIEKKIIWKQNINRRLMEKMNLREEVNSMEGFGEPSARYGLKIGTTHS